MDNKSRARNTTMGAMLMTAFAIGSYVTIPVFVLPLITKFGVGAGEVTLIFMFAGIGGLVTSLLLGTLMKKIPVKILVVSAGILLALFFVVLGLAIQQQLVRLVWRKQLLIGGMQQMWLRKLVLSALRLGSVGWYFQFYPVF
jgi:predicted MFS family arabinose efflux permease